MTLSNPVDTMNDPQLATNEICAESTLTTRSIAMWLLVLLFVAPVMADAQDFRGVTPASRNPSGYGNGTLTIDYEGFTIPRFDILVAATEIGRLADVNVEVGDHVKAGDVVATLEDSLQREAVESANWRSQMHGETDAAKAETSLMKLRFEQLKSLATKDMARPDELKRAAADWEIAKSRETSAIEQDHLRKLELKRYQLQLQRRKVLSPKDGVVAELIHSPGEYITPADPAVIRLVVLDQLYGVFNVPVEDMGAITLGDKVSVFLAGISKSVIGSVSSIAPNIDGESGTIKVKVLLDNGDGRLRSGDRCRMRPARLRTTLNTQGRWSPTNSPTRVGVTSQRRLNGIR